MKQATNHPKGLIPDLRRNGDDGLIAGLPSRRKAPGGLPRTDSVGRRSWECESA
jgi:hypothetical protein